MLLFTSPSLNVKMRLSVRFRGAFPLVSVAYRGCVMMWRVCLWSSLFMAIMPLPSQAQSSSSEWSLLSTPSPLKLKASARPAETTQSIAKRPPAPAAVEPGWNLSSDERVATLTYASGGKPAPLGFRCNKGDGFVTLRTPPVSFAPGKRMNVLLKSKNGTIRIDGKVTVDGERVIASESPVRTSSLVFVLTPKKGEAKLTVGGWSAEIDEGASDITLLRFQTLCDQPIVSADAN